MKFIDQATIKVQAGHGGPGKVSFRREKFVPFGGPDGGEGGAGGNVILVGDSGLLTLLDFQYQPRWFAEKGGKGEGSKRAGKDGKTLRIKVPLGTQVYRLTNVLTDNYDADAEGELVCDITQAGQEIILCKGGRGGKGNEFFKTATKQVPEYAQPGEPGEEGVFTLSLKLMADVGLVGFPNAGKSTLISRVSAAKPKIADYPFTTITPNLGVVKIGPEQSYVVADIPGLIPGASDGKGLGITFLKHVERCKVLAHLIDPTMVQEDGTTLEPHKAFELLMHELREFSPELASRPMVVVITKADAQSEEDLAKALASFSDHKCIVISSSTGRGIPELTTQLWQYVRG